MKRIITICTAILFTASVFAQSPEKMSYQAVIRNSSNALVSNSAVGIQISILQTSPSGTAVYVETQTPTTNANGLVSIEIGAGIVVSGNFSTINWANGPFFIKTETDPTGGTSYSITGTSELLSVPYALHAKTAENVVNANNLNQVLSAGNNANGNNIINTGQIGVGTTSPSISAAIDINTTTGALLLPRLTTAQRNLLTPTEGMMIFNTDQSKFQGYASVLTYSNTAVVDQSQNIRTTDYWIGNTASTQTFQSGMSGLLSDVTVYLSNNSISLSQNVTIEIYEGIYGVGSPALLSTGTVVIAPNSGIPGAFTIQPNVAVSTGQMYTIRVIQSNNYISWWSGSSNPYPQGEFKIDNSVQNNVDASFETTIKPSILVPQWVDLH